MRPPAGAFRLESLAIGDSCLFHIRGDKVLKSFPKSRVAGVRQARSSSATSTCTATASFSSIAWRRSASRATLSSCVPTPWRRGPWIAARGQPVRWSDYWQMPADAWIERRPRPSRGPDAATTPRSCCFASARGVESRFGRRRPGIGDGRAPLLAWRTADRTSAAAPAGPVEVPPEEETYGLGGRLRRAVEDRPVRRRCHVRSAARRPPRRRSRGLARRGQRVFRAVDSQGQREALRGADILQETKDAAIRKFHEKQREANRPAAT